MPIKPLQYVQAPAFTPLPYGLLTTLRSAIRTPSDPHWQHGVEFDSICPGAATTFDPCIAVTGTAENAVGLAPAKGPTSEIERRGATAFTVYAELDCSAPGFWDDAQRLTREVIGRSEQLEVERALWTGLVAGQPVVYPHLAANSEYINSSGITLQTAATIITGSPLGEGIIEAFGRLEQALAQCYNGIGVIHVPRALGPSLVNASIIREENGQYVSVNGNIVVLGAGYTNTSPAGASGGNNFWIYATGAMFIYRDTVSVTPSVSTLDRSMNNVSVIAERTYVIGWECCHLAVEVTSVI